MELRVALLRKLHDLGVDHFFSSDGCLAVLALVVCVAGQPFSTCINLCTIGGPPPGQFVNCTRDPLTLLNSYVACRAMLATTDHPALQGGLPRRVRRCATDARQCGHAVRHPLGPCHELVSRHGHHPVRVEHQQHDCVQRRSGMSLRGAHGFVRRHPLCCSTTRSSFSCGTLRAWPTLVTRRR